MSLLFCAHPVLTHPHQDWGSSNTHLPTASVNTPVASCVGGAWPLRTHWLFFPLWFYFPPPLFLFFLNETGSHYVAQAGLELLTLLPQLWEFCEISAVYCYAMLLNLDLKDSSCTLPKPISLPWIQSWGPKCERYLMSCYLLKGWGVVIRNW
jgi:hypothetical protein